MGGGDLLNLLIERDVFEEDFTRFYIAEASILGFFGLVSQLTGPALRTARSAVLDGAGC